jgi:hypothetical protein
LSVFECIYKIEEDLCAFKEQTPLPKRRTIHSLA